MREVRAIEVELAGGVGINSWVRRIKLMGRRELRVKHVDFDYKIKY